MTSWRTSIGLMLVGVLVTCVVYVLYAVGTGQGHDALGVIVRRAQAVRSSTGSTSAAQSSGASSQRAPSSALSALERQIQSAGAGSTINLSAGTYTITGPIEVQRSLTLAGAGSGQTTILFKGSGTLLSSSASRLVIRGVTLARESKQLGNVLNVTAGTVNLNDVQLVGGVGDAARTYSGAGLVLSGRASATVTASEVTANTQGVVLQGNSSIQLSGSHVHANQERGVSFNNASGGTVRENRIERNGFGVGNDYWQGIGLSDHANPEIHQNQIRDNAGPGIQYLGSSAGVATLNEVSGNSVNYSVHRALLGRDISAGGIVIGMRGQTYNPAPSPLVDRNNRYSANQGGTLVDYR